MGAVKLQKYRQYCEGFLICDQHNTNNYNMQQDNECEVVAQPQKRRVPHDGRAPVWSYFSRDKLRKRTECLVSGCSFKTKEKKPSNLEKHLQRHPLVYDELKQRKCKTSKGSGEQAEDVSVITSCETIAPSTRLTLE